MPISFTHDAALKILFTTAHGLVTFSDIQNHVNQETNGYSTSHRELIDASLATTDLTADQSRELVQLIKCMAQKRSFGPTAIVTANDMVFGMASMIAILSELQGGPLIGVFRTFDEGLKWLLRPA
jgi:hypothetical protein